jgi:hypothetical protein
MSIIQLRTGEIEHPYYLVDITFNFIKNETVEKLIIILISLKFFEEFINKITEAK